MLMLIIFLMGVGITAMVAVVGCDDGRLNYLRGSLRVYLIPFYIHSPK